LTLSSTGLTTKKRFEVKEELLLKMKGEQSKSWFEQQKLIHFIYGSIHKWLQI